MGDHFQKALKLLAAGDLKAATNLHNEISTAIQALEADRELIIEMIARSKEDAPTQKGGRAQQKGKIAPIAPRLRKISQAERSELIKKHALELASTNGDKLKISVVEEAIKAAGVDIGTKVPGTVIANVLMKAEGWNRVGKGVFQRAQQ